MNISLDGTLTVLNEKRGELLRVADRLPLIVSDLN